MACYTVPIIGALICYGWRKATRAPEPKYFWLNFMLLGSSIFGVVDHWWNGELLLLGPNPATDLALGFAILLITVAAWGAMVMLPSLPPTAAKAA